jgi:hypothetical protein
LARVADQFTGRDLTFWAVFALVCWGIAGVGGALGFLVPQDIFNGLHASRLRPATLTQLEGEVSDLGAAAADLEQQNDVVRQRLTLGEMHNADVTKRVGALELQVPKLLEATREAQPLDAGAITAATGGEVTTMPADGGSVRYTMAPLTGGPAGIEAPAAQPMPRTLTPMRSDASRFGVALGPPIVSEDGATAWLDLNDRIGTLLLGLKPLLGHVEGSASRRLVAGPLGSEAETRTLCGQIAKVGIACAAVPFIGDPLK